jgi:hypothetical protein
VALRDPAHRAADGSADSQRSTGIAVPRKSRATAGSSTRCARSG